MARWMYTDTTATIDCPKCKVKAGVVCKTPKGKDVNGLIPHKERIDAFYAHPSFDITKYQARVLSVYEAFGIPEPK